MIEIILYIIIGFLGLFALVLLIIGIHDGTLFTEETEKERIERLARKRDRQRKRERFMSPSTSDGKTIFGFPMKDV